MIIKVFLNLRNGTQLVTLIANRKKIEDVANKDSIFNRDWF